MKLLILVGKAGVGKTAVRKPLAERLHARSIGPDDHPYRWDWAVRQLDSARIPAVLECCQIPRAVRARMDHETVVVELVVSGEERRRRLYSQGHDTEEVARRLHNGSSDTLAYEDDGVQPTLTVEVGKQAPDEVARQLASDVSERWGITTQSRRGRSSLA